MTSSGTLAKAKQQHKRGLPAVLVMTDDARLTDPVAVASTMPSTWGLVFRHYGAPDREALARTTAAICHARSITLVIAADWRLAERVKADGVHLPEHAVNQEPMAPVQLWRRTGKFLTLAAHGPRGLRRAAALNADGVLLSPVAPTPSHPDSPVLGAFRFSVLARTTSCPVYALGGVTLAQQKRLTALGASGIAGISLFRERC